MVTGLEKWIFLKSGHVASDVAAGRFSGADGGGHGGAIA